MRLVFKKCIPLIFLLLLTGYGFAQDSPINQYDENGDRHGVWKKYYENSDQLRYEGTFEHGRETGTFKFYTPKSGRNPISTKTYTSENDTIIVRFYDAKGDFKKSEGEMIGQSREGKWSYYKKGYKENLIMVEHYQNDQLHGVKKTFFKNGKVTEIEEYKKGLKNGKKKIYAMTGQLLQEYEFQNDTLQGFSATYDADGQKTSEGNYKKGLRDGEWKFYTDGKLDSLQTYPIKRPKLK